jgi:hypothetical protein
VNKHTKRFLSKMAAGLSLALFSLTAAHAAETTWFGDGKAAGSFEVGVKTGKMLHDSRDVDSANSNAIVLGYTFARPMPGNGSASVEFEATGTYDKGRFGPNSFMATTGDWDVTTKALYIAYRTGGTVYFKGKAGFTDGDVTYTPDSGVGEYKKSRAEASIGGGVGVRVTDHANVEVEYTGGMGDNRIKFVSVGANFNF